MYHGDSQKSVVDLDEFVLGYEKYQGDWQMSVVDYEKYQGDW